MAWTSAIHGLPAPAVMGASHHLAVSSQDPINTVTLFGMASVAATILCYVNRHHGRSAMLIFAISLVVTACYAFAAGAWPLGMLELFWGIRSGRLGIHRALQGLKDRSKTRSFVSDLSGRQARYGHLHGMN